MSQPRRYSDIGSRESFFGDVDEDGYIVEDNYEEDQQNFDPLMIIEKIKDAENMSCPNTSVLTFETLSITDSDITLIKTKNNNNSFVEGFCISKSEIIEALKSDLASSSPTYIMSIYTTPKKMKDRYTGFTGKATGKIIIRLTNNMYITLGSAYRLLHSKDKILYALPLFGGNKRRIGNLQSLYGASMNHGAIPGEIIFKLYTNSEIESGVVVNESRNDYPLSLFINYQTETLFNILGLDELENIRLIKNKILIKFINSIIKYLITYSNEIPISQPSHDLNESDDNESDDNESEYGNDESDDDDNSAWNLS
jgi:hypothetical protein